MPFQLPASDAPELPRLDLALLFPFILQIGERIRRRDAFRLIGVVRQNDETDVLRLQQIPLPRAQRIGKDDRAFGQKGIFAHVFRLIDLIERIHELFGGRVFGEFDAENAGNAVVYVKIHLFPVRDHRAVEEVFRLAELL